VNPKGSAGFLQQFRDTKREQWTNCWCSYMGVFVLLFFFIFATIVIYSPTPGGRVNKHMGSKLLCKIDKVKFMDGALSTSNSHPIKLFSYSHIVYSIFYCKFEVLQRCSQPNTTIMKAFTNWNGIQIEHRPFFQSCLKLWRVARYENGEFYTSYENIGFETYEDCLKECKK
tara:strand:- start:218 stop:730 length:513 start_codon:yes stop_codon:yes gene_type:complete